MGVVLFLGDLARISFSSEMGIYESVDFIL